MAISNSIPQKNRNTEDDLQLGRVFGLLLDHKWFIIVSVFVFALIATIYVLSATPIYQADSLVQVEKTSSGLSALPSMTEPVDNTNPETTTEIELLKSRMILGDAVDELNLDIQIKPDVPYGISLELVKRFGWSSGSIQISRFNVPTAYEGRQFKLLVAENNTYQLLRDRITSYNVCYTKLLRSTRYNDNYSD